MNFKNKITDYVGSTDGYTDAQAQRFISDGCFDVFKKSVAVRGFDEGLKFGTWFDTSESVNDVDEIKEILLLKRNSVPATKVSANLQHKFSDTDSIHYASTNDPIFYIEGTQLTILPVPTVAQPARFLYLPLENTIKNYTGLTTNSSAIASSIDNFPAEYYDHALVYASIKLLEQIMHTYIQDEEDSELAQTITLRLDRLKVEYNEMFGAQS